MLGQFKETTEIISASSYPTLSSIIPGYNTLIDHLEDMCSKKEVDKTIKEAAAACLEKFKEYYNKTNKASLLAVILDPRFKIEYYEINKWEEMVSEIKER